MVAPTSDVSEPWVEEETTFNSGVNELFGILTLPTTKGPYYAVVLLHGSDRRGVDYPYYVDHSRKLVRSGFAVLRYDSPGVGRSSGSIIGETLESRAREAVSAVKHLQSRGDVRSDGVGLWGISQGGWICQMAAAAYDGVAFIITVSGPGVTVTEQEVHRVEMQSRAAGFSEDEVARAVMMRRLLVDVVLSEPMYRAINEAEAERLGEGPWIGMMGLVYSSEHVEPGLELEGVMETLSSVQDESWARYLHIGEILKIFESLSPEAWGGVKASYGAVMELDPADHLTRVHCPVLAIFGEEDKVLPVDRSVALYERYLGEAGNEDVTIKVFPNANHNIYVDEEPAPGYYETMIDWLSNLPLE